MVSILQRAVQAAANQLKQAPIANYFQAGRAFMTDIYGPIYPSSDYRDLVTNGYKRNPDLYAVVRLLTRAGASLPWYLVTLDADGNEQEYRNPELMRRLERPSPGITFNFWIEQCLTDYLLAGNQYNYTIDVMGKVQEWVRLRPDYIAVNTSSNLMAPIRSYQYTYGVNTELPVERVTHWRMFDPLNEWYGMSPLEAAIRSVAMGNAGIDWNTATLQNMGRFSGIMKFADSLSPEQRDQIYRAYEDRLAGSRNAGKPLVTDLDFEWQQTSMSMLDADWINGLNLTKQQIAAVYGVDSGLIGDKTASTYNNMEQATLRMYYDVVIPMMSGLSDVINMGIVQTWDANARLRFDFEAIDAIKRDQATAYQRLEQVSFLTFNEKRREIGYENIEDPAMDVIYINAGAIPISEANIDVNVLPAPELPDEG